MRNLPTGLHRVKRILAGSGSLRRWAITNTSSGGGVWQSGVKEASRQLQKD